MERLLADNSTLKMDPMAMAFGMIYAPNMRLINCGTSARDAGASDATEDTILSWHSIHLQKEIQLYKQAADQAVGARKEVATIWWILDSTIYLPIAGTAKAAALMHDWLESKQSAWGGPADRSQLMHCYNVRTHSRHFEICRNSEQRMDFFLNSNSASAVAGHACDMKQAKQLLAKQFSAWDDYVEAAPAPGVELGNFLSFVAPTCLGCDALHGCRPQLVRLLANFECTHVAEVGRWCAESVHLAIARAQARSSKDGQLHFHHTLCLKTMTSAVLSLAAAGTGSDVGAARMLDDLPLEDDRRVTDAFNAICSCASARCLVAECFEQHGMLEAAIKWARAELADPLVNNSPSMIRAGRLIGRAHAALGQHELSIAAFDAAAELARVGRYLESELLTAQSRAVAGRAAGGVDEHWSEGSGRERVLEVVGRLRPSGGEAEREAIGAAVSAWS